MKIVQGAGRARGESPYHTIWKSEPRKEETNIRRRTGVWPVLGRACSPTTNFFKAVAPFLRTPPPMKIVAAGGASTGGKPLQDYFQVRAYFQAFPGSRAFSAHTTTNEKSRFGRRRSSRAKAQLQTFSRQSRPRGVPRLRLGTSEIILNAIWGRCHGGGGESWGSAGGCWVWLLG